MSGTAAVGRGGSAHEVSILMRDRRSTEWRGVAAALEGLDDEHASAAAGAWLRRHGAVRHLGARCLGLFGRRRGHCEQLAHALASFSALSLLAKRP